MFSFFLEKCFLSSQWCSNVVWNDYYDSASWSLSEMTIVTHAKENCPLMQLFFFFFCVFFRQLEWNWICRRMGFLVGSQVWLVLCTVSYLHTHDVMLHTEPEAVILKGSFFATCPFGDASETWALCVLRTSASSALWTQHVSRWINAHGTDTLIRGYIS